MRSSPASEVCPIACRFPKLPVHCTLEKSLASAPVVFVLVKYTSLIFSRPSFVRFRAY